MARPESAVLVGIAIASASSAVCTREVVMLTEATAIGVRQLKDS